METKEKNFKTCGKPNRMRKFIFGTVVILAGLALLGFNVGYIPIEYKSIIFSWQMLLIAIGVINIFGRESVIPGAILISIGTFFLVPMLHDFNFNFVGIFWPILLIVLGVLIIFKRSLHHKPWHKCHNKQTNFVIEDGFIQEENVFSGNKRMIQPGVFRGGKISNVFGGTEIDLTQTTLPEGKSYLTIDCVFGGVSIIAPIEWDIQIAVKAVMGGFVDKRRFVKPLDNSRQLIIQGSAVFGGGELKSY